MIKDISIVIVNYNQCEYIKNLLGTIVADGYGGHIVSFVLVDNSLNADCVREMIETHYPFVHYIDPGRNLGFAAGNNLGLRHIEARYYFCLNGDTEFINGTNTLGSLVRFMEDNPKIGMIAPRLVDMSMRRQNSCYRFDIWPIIMKPLRHTFFYQYFPQLTRLNKRLQMEDFDQAKTQPIDWALGAALFVRGVALQAVGLFDERYFLYLEDCDWCRSFWDRGWPVYFVHNIVIKHRYSRASASMSGIVKSLIYNVNTRRHIVSWCRYILKWGLRSPYYSRVK